jgi:putative protein kinase ArgK-like GTPase of G3E family
MAWSYTDDPESVPRDAVRFALGDTDEADQQCSDAQVAYALAETGNVAKLAAALLADRLAARYAREEAASVDGISLGGAGRASAYRLLATQLRAEVARTAVPVPDPNSLQRSGSLVVTGLRQSDLVAGDADYDRPAPLFRRTDPLAEPAFTQPPRVIL